MLKKCFVATCTSPTATSASGALLTSMWGKSCNLSDVTTDPDQLVTLFVDQQLALGTFEALTTQAPDTIMAVCTKSSLKKRQEIRQFRRQLMVVWIQIRPPDRHSRKLFASTAQATSALAHHSYLSKTSRPSDNACPRCQQRQWRQWQLQ